MPKKTVSKSTTDVKTTKKTTTTKGKSTTKKKVDNSKKVTTSKKAVKSKKVNQFELHEYYDLPNKYNKTMVRVLFQTPKKLFVYWEISENDRLQYLKEFGDDFFETTSPFLVVKNKTKNYSFEIEINDFANSWYFDVPDSNNEYEIELIRKNKVTNTPTPITVSNELDVPNNHILFEQNRKEVFFKNIKTNELTSKSIVNLQFINHVGNTHPAVKFYNEIYSQKDLLEITNPSSN